MNFFTVFVTNLVEKRSLVGAARFDRAAENELDLSIIARVRRGDTNAFSELVVKYKYPVWSLVRRYTGNSPESEDICQEAFLSLWKALPAFKGRSRFFTWFYRIIMNTCHNQARKPEMKIAALDGGGTERLPDLRENPLALVERADLAEKAGKAIEELPDALKDALILRNSEGLSYSEIAEILGISVGTVKSRIHNARIIVGEKLRKLL